MMRPKRLTTLQAITHSLETSIEKAKRSKDYNSVERKEGYILKKEIKNPYVKSFNVRKLKQGESQVQQRKMRFKSLRMHTEKLIASPEKPHNPFNERSQTVEARLADQQEAYPFLTKFQREEISRFEVFFIGSRRIHSLKDFTSSTCEARVSVGDSISYRYEILSGLGEGSFGQVFKAFDHKKRETVALKIIRNEAKFNRQAKVEMKILQTVILHDPKFRSNIVQLKHGFFFRGHACLSFELLHTNLYEFLRQYKFNGLKPDFIRRISIQVLQGLLFLKKFNIIHCDLKPENILLKQENKTGVKIIDVGSGCFQQEQIYTYIQSRFYRAPEVILGIPYTTAIDIWSLGCVICELFLGFPIFPGENQPEQLLMFMQVLGVPPIPLIENGSRSNKFFEGIMPKIKPNSKGKIRRPNTRSLDKMLEACGQSEFIDFVKRFLMWDPDERIKPYDALLHPWIIKGLPEEIRKQHVAAVHRQTYLDN